MARYPSSVDYQWTKRDSDIRDGLDPHLKRPTPYDVPPEQISGVKELTPGTKVSIPLAGSWSSWYLLELTPDGYEWREVPEYAKSAATVGELCALLLAKAPAVFPPLYYDIANKSTLRRYGTPIERLLFDHWENTEWRYATTLLEVSGGFSWSAISPALATKAGDVSLRKVLAKKPTAHRPAVAPGTSQGAVIRGRPRTPQIVRAQPEFEPRTLEVGYNYPWAFNKYGLYFGPHTETWIDLWIMFFRRNLRELAELGIKYLRIFLMGSGETMGSATAADGYDALVHLPTDEEVAYYRTSMQHMLEAVKTSGTGIKLIPSFIAFKMFGPLRGNSGARRILVLDGSMRRQFLNRVLDPLLDVSVPYADHIYAWEVINEPAWTYLHWAEPLHGHYWATPPLTKEQMNVFLADAISHIKRAGFAATVGHRFYDDLTEMPAGDKPQFHYYGKVIDPNPIPNCPNGDTFIGEIDAAHTHGPSWPELKGVDDDPQKCLFARLESLEKKIALVWPDLKWTDPEEQGQMSLYYEEFVKRVDEPIGFSQAAKRSIKEFTKGKPKRPAK